MAMAAANTEDGIKSKYTDIGLERKKATSEPTSPGVPSCDTRLP